MADLLALRKQCPGQLADDLARLVVEMVAHTDLDIRHTVDSFRPAYAPHATRVHCFDLVDTKTGETLASFKTHGRALPASYKTERGRQFADFMKRAAAVVQEKRTMK